MSDSGANGTDEILPYIFKINFYTSHKYRSVKAYEVFETKFGPIELTEASGEPINLDLHTSDSSLRSE